MNRLTFTVLGVPRPQGSKTLGRHGAMYDASKHLKAWRRTVAIEARNAWPYKPATGAVIVQLDFVFHAKKAKGWERRIKRPDLDKLARACFDSLTGIVFVDDSQVAHVLASKWDANEEPRVCISVEAE